MPGLLTPLPLQFIRQYVGSVDVDSIFATTAARNAYLTSPRRTGGQLSADLEEQAVYMLNTARDAWIPVGSNNIVIGLGSKQFTKTFDGSAGSGAVGTLDIELTDVPINAFIAFAWIDVGEGLTADDDTAYITLGIETDAPAAALDSTTGLVTDLNTNIVTGILNPDYTKATDVRSIVMSVGGSNITAGSVRVIIVITDKLVQESGDGTPIIELQVNGTDNQLQNLLNLVDSDTVTFEDLGLGAVTAHAAASANTIYSANDVLASDRAVGLNGHTLSFTDGGGNDISIDPINRVSEIDVGDGTSFGTIGISANTSGFVEFVVAVNNGVNDIGVVGDANANTLKLLGFGLGDHVGTPVYSLQVDSSGNVIEGNVTPDLQQVTDVGYTTTNLIISTAGIFAVNPTPSTNIEVGAGGGSGSKSISLVYDHSLDEVYLRYNQPFTSTLKTENVTSSRTWQLPDQSGTVALSVNGNFADSTGNITLNALGYEQSATYSAISGSTDSRWIRVAADETNNGDKSLYLYTNGIGIEFIQTIA